MSYNTRRSGPGVNAIGQRRPQGNFVHGGQLNPKQQQQQRQQNDGYQGGHYQGQQGQGQQQRQNQPSQQQKPSQNMGQQQQNQGQQSQQQNQQPSQQKQQAPQQNQQAQQQNQQSQQQNQQTQQQPRPNLQENAQALVNQIQNQAPPKAVPPPKVEDIKIDAEDTTVQPAGEGVKEKPFWIKKTAGRISRAERVRRRNMRLKKVLQPKNALMVLNELVGNTAYTITDSKTGYNQDIFNASLCIDGDTFNGLGKSKVAAKTAAAEQAIKAIILKKLRNKGKIGVLEQAPTDGDDEKMDEQQQQEEDLSWSHIANFAIHKLFSSWDDEEGGDLVELFSAINSSNNADGGATLPRSTSLTKLQSNEQKPAKKLPENAAHLNPSMLLNQMYPHAKYEEVARTGNPPNVQFTISCTVDGQTFTGVGQNKKAARKQAAFEACKTLLKIEYPPEVFDQKTEAMQVDVDSNMPF